MDNMLPTIRKVNHFDLKRLIKNFFIILGLLALAACTTDAAAQSVEDITSQAVVEETQIELEVDSDIGDDSQPDGWDDETHSKSADPNYDVVFPQDEVNRLDISIDPEYWDTMLADMTEIYGESGSQTQRRPQAADGEAPLMGNISEEDAPAAAPGNRPDMPPGGEKPAQGEKPGMDRPQAGGVFGGMEEGDDNNPIWVPVTVEFEDDTWTNVGLRFKGNSSLRSSWSSGNMKLPLKLDFDQFEDDYPEIDDQRFYGFKQLTLSSNYLDNSLLREKAAADIFREAGVPSAHTAFYEVYIDYGEGPIYFGLYTMVEVVDDTVIEEQFSDSSGNLYKPSGSGASFAFGTFSEESFDKETNEEEADWSDIQVLYEALHSDLRTTSPDQWRTNLESVFDVDGFLNWLAVNTVIQNWDTYGMMTHNYYLYNDPDTGLLTWIPWDNNESLMEKGRQGTLSLSLDEVSDQWPLISYLMDDPVYQETYASYVEAVIQGPFNPDEITVKYQELHDLISPYVVGPNGEAAGYTNLASDAAFESSVTDLSEQAYSRYQAAQAYLESIVK